MTTTATFQTTGSGVSFLGLLNSEWIKLRSLRSTVWCYSIVFVMTIGIGLLFALAISALSNGEAGSGQSLVGTVVTTSIAFSQLVIGVLGALIITGEYGTGMIRSTFTASPRRFTTLLAKAVVLAVVTFIVGLVSILATCLAVTPLLGNRNLIPDYADGALWGVFVGGAGYLALVALIALAVGTLLRSSAGAISATLGLYFVAPIVLSIFSMVTRSQVVMNISSLLPSAAGGQMYTYPVDHGPAPAGLLVLDPFLGLLVSLAWVVVLGGIASVVLKRRDV